MWAESSGKDVSQCDYFQPHYRTWNVLWEGTIDIFSYNFVEIFVEILMKFFLKFC